MMKKMLFSIQAAIFLCAMPIAHAQDFEIPPNDGFVTDSAGLFTTEQEQSLEDRLSLYAQESSNEIALLTIQSLNGEVIADLAVDIGRKWGVGGEENDNGILILIAYEEREMFLATGYGLEGALPDIVAKGIIDTDMIPAFREGKYYEGVDTAVTSIQKHITGEYEASRYETHEGGGMAWLFLVIMIIINGFGAFLARSKSWWLGGMLGFVGGLILTFIFSWWISIPVLTVLGFIFDYIVSKNPRMFSGGRRSSSWRGGGRGGGGGFGGFGGGSFGGGGAGGKW